jgi:steroid 5-alpha reductase family enzyme
MNDNGVNIYTLNLAAVVMTAFAGWLLSLKTENVTVADTLWAAGFVLIAWISFFFSEGWIGRKWLLAAMTTCWGVRLGLYMFVRNRGKKEDPRYAAWREKYGENFRIVSLFNVFLVQALFLWLISLSLQRGMISGEPNSWTWTDLAGAAVWMAGFWIETVADRQLFRFKSDPANKGKIMDRGLWAYSRHPNYFGESLVWWGVFLVGLSTPSSWWTVLSPMLITAVLVWMTGVALTEETILRTRPAYRDYMKKTSAFIPWPPSRNPQREDR